MEVIIVVFAALAGLSALAVLVVLALGVTVRRSPALDREAEAAALAAELEQGEREARRGSPG